MSSCVARSCASCLITFVAIRVESFSSELQRSRPTVDDCLPQRAEIAGAYPRSVHLRVSHEMRDAPASLSLTAGVRSAGALATRGGGTTGPSAGRVARAATSSTATTRIGAPQRPPPPPGRAYPGPCSQGGALEIRNRPI